jgi:hypothetical protein
MLVVDTWHWLTEDGHFLVDKPRMRPTTQHGLSFSRANLVGGRLQNGDQLGSILIAVLALADERHLFLEMVENRGALGVARRFSAISRVTRSMSAVIPLWLRSHAPFAR